MPIRPLDAAELLDVWELGRGRHPIDRALVLLAFASPDQDWEQLCALPVGERNRRLLALRAATFGPRLDLVTACPRCGEQLEFDFTFPLDQLQPILPGTVERPLPGGAWIRLRLPDSRDLAAVAATGDGSAGEQVLLSRCLLGHLTDGANPPIGLGGGDIGAGGLAGASAWAALKAAFTLAVEEADPLASIGFPVNCPDCGQAWEARLDPLDYLWRELHQRAIQLSREVHQLARAYGWTEGEILRLSPARRRLYLEQVEAM
jgi:hypothetical protein